MISAATENSVKNRPISGLLGAGNEADQFVQGMQDTLDEQAKQRQLAASGGGQQKSMMSQMLGIV